MIPQSMLHPILRDPSLSQLEKAIIFATVKHSGQKHSFGGQYILHPLRVMGLLARMYPENSILHQAGVLHDTVEDTDATLAEIAEFFGPGVLGIVDCVSRRPDETYSAMINRITQFDPAIIVKLADLKDNLQLGVEHPLPERNTLSQRYVMAVGELMDALDEGLSETAEKVLFG